MADAARVWRSREPAARLTRGALLPFGFAFRAASALRNTLYDAGILRTRALGAPAVSVGNLSVGGTGKTPFAAWVAAELRARGASPAILLRGFGGDEALVLRALAPGIPVLEDADRVAAAQRARTAGADVLVLDDAFQHRRAARDADIVLVSADAGLAPPWPLPAGPWREPLSALRRATMVLVTRKAASDEMVGRALAAVGHAAPHVPAGVARLDAGELCAWNSRERQPLAALRGRRALAVSGIGDPGAFEAQLADAGVSAEPVRFPDHYHFRGSDVRALVTKGEAAGVVLCTLKDAVKLGPQWPPGAVSLWYVSQRVTVDRGADVLAGVIDRLLDLRSDSQPHREGH